MVAPVPETTYSNDSEATLNDAIQKIDVGGADAAPNTAYTIDITGTIDLTTALLAINLESGSSLTIAGTTGFGGVEVQTLDGGHSQRGLFVYAGNVTVENLTIQNMSAVGGAGGGGDTGSGLGGGGGAGLGGGLFVTGSSDGVGGANVTLDNVSFINDAATGGAGGGGGAERVGGGGGGGLGGAGGIGSSTGGGGGGGIGGQAGGAFTGNAGRGIIPGEPGGGTDSKPVGSRGYGGLSGGGGGGSTGGGGGGGVGGGNGASVPSYEASGGNGGFGGGGGGVVSGPSYRPDLEAAGGGGGFGGGGGGGAGGPGGFGGGGGGGGASVTGGPGGAGGFGAGAGAASGGGGGGLGAGGDIFVQQGGSLTIEGGSLTAGTVTAGLGAGDAGNGSAYGGGIFIQGDQSITFAPPADQTLTINDVIADQSGSGGAATNGGAGSVVVDGAGTVALDATNTFTGGITLEQGTLDLATAGAAGTGAITFLDPPPTDPTLEFTPANAPTNAIEGFGPGDTIQIDDFLETSLSYSDGILTLQGTDTSGTIPESFTLDIPGQALADFQPMVGATDTGFDYAPCYCRGTLIGTGRGEKPVEKLKIGDQVMTKSGALRPIKWIGRRSYSGRFVIGRKDILPICIKAGALDENVPRRDLWISPHHAMYLDGVLIEAKDLVNGASIVQTERVEEVEYFHIELDSHDVIIAEGALSESFIDDDSRSMFHNGHEYRALYPEAAPGLAQYCAQRHEDGYEVEAARRRIALRAGTRLPDDELWVGALRGFIDLVSPRCIAGWAQNVDYPEAPVCLDIYAGNRLIGQILANRYREDLKRAGLGSGCHSFEFTSPDVLDFVSDALEVRRSLDGAELELSVHAQRRLQRLSVSANKSGRNGAAAATRCPTAKVHGRAASG